MVKFLIQVHFNTNMCLKDAVLIDRLKMEFVCEPVSSPYFMDSVQTQRQTDTIPVDMEMHHQQMGTQSRGVHSTSSSTEPILLQPMSVRPKRTIRKPVRYRNSTCVSENIGSSSDWSSRYKMKRIVGQKQIDNDKQYTVTLCGELSHKSFWVSRKDIDAKALIRIAKFPPPVLS